MPLCANQTIKLTRRQYDGPSDADIEYTAQIRRVSVQPRIGARTSGGGAAGADLLQIRIFSGYSKADVSGGYLPYPDWLEMADTERSDYWTLREGDTVEWQGRTFAVDTFHDNRIPGRRNPHIYVEAS